MRGDDRQSFTGLYNMKERKEEDVLRKQGNKETVTEKSAPGNKEEQNEEKMDEGFLAVIGIGHDACRLWK
jgi:hypothetical protein